MDNFLEFVYKCFLPIFFLDSRDWQTGGKDRQLLCWDCRAHLKKTNELPLLTAPAALGAAVTNGTGKDVKDSNGKDSNKEDSKEKGEKDKDGNYLFRPVNESPDASPQRMRTRNKAAKEQTNSRGTRPKRGAETPEPKGPKQNANSPGDKNSTPNTPAKKKGGKNEKTETPNTKNRKRTSEKIEEAEEEKELGMYFNIKSIAFTQVPNNRGTMYVLLIW